MGWSATVSPRLSARMTSFSGCSCRTALAVYFLLRALVGPSAEPASCEPQDHEEDQKMLHVFNE